MVIAVGDTRVYKFPQSTVAAEIYSDRVEILVLPERRKFILRLKPEQIERLQQAYPQHTPRYTLTTRIANALKDGFLQVDEEIA